MTWSILLDRLAAGGHLTPAEHADAAQQPPEQATAASLEADPWYVRLLVAGGAWLAAILFLTFLGSMDWVDTPRDAMRIGAVLLVGATALRWRIETLFGTQLLLALSLLGQVGVIGGLVAETEAAAWAWALGALLEAALVALYPDALHRFLATLAALLLAVGAAVAAEAQASVHMLVGGAALGVLGFWDREGRLDLRAVAGLGPVGYGLAVGLLLVLVGSVGPDVWRDMVWWPSTLVLTAVLLALVVRVLDELEVPLREPWAVALMVGLVGLGAVSWFAPGIVGALFVSALAVRHQRRVLLGVALMALGGFLIAFYYNLEQTLLAKSFLLMASGGVLLGLRAVLPLHTRRRHA